MKRLDASNVRHIINGQPIFYGVQNKDLINHYCVLYYIIDDE